MARRLSQLAHLPVTELKGVGETRASALAKVGVDTVLDLLTYYPRRYIDRTNQARLSELGLGEEATVLVTVLRTTGRRTRNGKSLVTADVTDGSGHLRVTFFNQPFRERQLKEGSEVVLFGRVEEFQGQRQMTNPVVDLIGDKTGADRARLPAEREGRDHDAGTSPASSTRCCGGPVTSPIRCRPCAAPPFRPGRPDRRLHRHPRARHDARRAPTPAAAWCSTSCCGCRSSSCGASRSSSGPPSVSRTPWARVAVGHLVDRFHERLPYDLTGAQHRAIDEIVVDLAEPHPMHRLLQGDVGSGKTVVAVSALLVAVQGGHQGALMAPTEVLAEQHFASVRHLLDGLHRPRHRRGQPLRRRRARPPVAGRAAHRTARRRPSADALLADLAAGDRRHRSSAPMP